MDLGPQIPGDGKLFSCGEHKFRLFKGGNLIHVDDTVPVTAYELGITQQQTRKVMEPHIGSHGLILQVDLDVVVAVVRVQDIVNELHDEKSDIVRWDEDPAVYIANALSPAKVISVSVWEDDKSSYVIVPDYQLSLAIGKSGQNARLAAKLTGWKIDIKSESQAVQEGVLTPEGESEGVFDDTDDILGDIEAEGNTEDNE